MPTTAPMTMPAMAPPLRLEELDDDGGTVEGPVELDDDGGITKGPVPVDVGGTALEDRAAADDNEDDTRAGKV